MKVYLANPYLDKVYGEELEAKITALGIEVWNPFKVVEQPVYDKIIKDGVVIYTQKHLSDIVEGDLRAIERADAVVALVSDAPSIGVHMEVFYASRILRKPVFVLYKTSRMEGANIHPWYAFLTRAYRTEEELLKALDSWSWGN